MKLENFAILLFCLFVFAIAYCINVPELERCKDSGRLVKGVYGLVCINSKL